MKRRFVRAAAFWLALVLMVGCVTGVGAANEDHKHDETILLCLFGCPKQVENEKEREAQTALLLAASVALDQFNGKKDEDLQQLRGFGVEAIPETIENFDFSSNYEHRLYTHKGWDYDYKEDKANWAERKNILLSTVNHYFDFDLFGQARRLDDMGWLSSIPYHKKCDSFAALLYYLHVIADIKHQGIQDNRKGYMIPLTTREYKQNKKNERTNNDWIDEVKTHLSILFAEQTDELDYKRLVRELNAIQRKASSLVTSNGTLLHDYDLEQHKEYAGDVIKVLTKYLPKLLKNEPFFTSCFPSVKNQ